MDAQTYDQQIARVRELLNRNRVHWYRMDRAGVASYRYFGKLARGEIVDPNPRKLAAIEAYLEDLAA